MLNTLLLELGHLLMRLEFTVPVILIKNTEYAVEKVSYFDASLKDGSAVNYSLIFKGAICRTIFLLISKIHKNHINKVRFPPQFT